jgi:hypothetical protein
MRLPLLHSCNELIERHSGQADDLHCSSGSEPDGDTSDGFVIRGLDDARKEAGPSCSLLETIGFHQISILVRVARSIR